MSSYNHEPMLELFVFETTQLLEQLEHAILDSEKSSCYTQNAINEIFRIMHTIKGSSAMMYFNGISSLAHKVEDLFYFLREEKPERVDCLHLSDIVLESIDFIKAEMKEINDGNNPVRDATSLVGNIESFLSMLKTLNSKADSYEVKEQPTTMDEGHRCGKGFKAVVYFEPGCEMENLRAYTLVHNLKAIIQDVYYIPADINENDSSRDIIRKEGFQIWFTSDLSLEEIHHFFSQTIFLKDLELVELENKETLLEDETNEKSSDRDTQLISSHQSIISVNVVKLDKLMDLIGELVISEAMVTQNTDLSGLGLDNFQKAARQHRKIIDELQDIAMSIRMVPLSTTLQKMNRIVRDMSKKLSKEVRLEIIGEETEVDKNIIEHISDPLMHLIRNAIDHGIESAEERKAKGKSEAATVTLEAKNAGGDVLIIVKDDGRGLNKDKILARAKESGLIYKSENELSDREIYSCIFHPGFSTNDQVTEFSGRGVGMDVVTKNIGAVGGTVTVDSIRDEGTMITLKIPLTLAIMNGMIVRVGKSIFTVPIISIKESFKAKEKDLITDPDGNEMIMIRGECYPVLRLHEIYKVNTDISNIPDGIIVMVENEGKGLCIFVDGLIGEQQVVVKALPSYIRNIKKVRGLAGCTLLGDGSISLILDIAGLIES